MRNLAVFLAASIATFSQPIVAGEASSGGGERVVVLHGLARSADSMSRMAHALEMSGYRVCNVSYLAADFVAPAVRACLSGEPGVLHAIGIYVFVGIAGKTLAKQGVSG